ncbi:DNA-directed RNA polymerase subunit alpha [Anaerolineales bacterium HSG6]|nr:DNA-directed RNA polymerase subunit alpha [Anaerolineales bacterium HSG6]MDM8530064.1 DNA-directed RNA polymerase subunit alpha [Anaerolineales bacterium HSG25]
MSDFNLVLPKIETEAISQGSGRFSIGPLENGYGITLGNALRRVLLSSLTGAAVTSIRVSGVHHEFSNIPNVREDMTALILNVKQLRFKLFQNESVRLRAEVRGVGIVTGGDLVGSSTQVEIINPELPLLVVDSPDAELDLELVVQMGRGYSPAEERGKLPIGEIPVDAIFSPIRKANYSVERARIGQATDYDRLLLDVTTDGTIFPRDALSESAKILVQHFSLVSGATEIDIPVEVEEEGEIPNKLYEAPIEELELSVRAYNCLKRAGITQIGEILQKLKKGQDELLAIRNFGQKSLDELMDKLEEKGFLNVLTDESDNMPMSVSEHLGQ